MTVKPDVVTILPPFLRRYAERIEASPLGYRLARGAFWSLCGAVVSRGVTLASFIVVARMLGKTGFGELGIIQSTIGVFSVFAGFGLGVTATKHVAEFRQKDPARAGRIIALSTVVSAVAGAIVSVLLFASASLLAAKTLAAPHLAAHLRTGALLLVFGAMNGVQVGALAGFEAFKTATQVNLAAGLLAFPAVVGGAYLGGVKGAIWGLVAGLIVNSILGQFALTVEARRAGVPLVFSGFLTERKILLSFSFPALLASLLVGPVSWVCSALLVNRRDGYSEMGLFNAANQWFAAMMFLPGVIGNAILPLLSERIAANDTASTKNAMIASMKIVAAIVLPVAALACVGSPYIMSLYGDEFSDAWPILVVVVATAALVAVQAMVSQILVASAQIWTGFLMNLGWGTVFIAMTVILIGKGAMGLATARLVAYLVHSVWTLYFAYKFLFGRTCSTSSGKSC